MAGKLRTAENLARIVAPTFTGYTSPAERLGVADLAADILGKPRPAVANAARARLKAAKAALQRYQRTADAASKKAAQAQARIDKYAIILKGTSK